MYRLGVDLGGTNIVVGLVDEIIKIVDKVSCKTNLPRAAKSIIEDIARLCNKVVEENRIDAEDVEAVGVGVGKKSLLWEMCDDELSRIEAKNENDAGIIGAALLGME